MATLSSSSTLAQVEAEYDDNASWFEDQSLTKAKAFVTACTILLRRLYRLQSKGANTLGFDPERIEEQRKEAKEWLTLNDPNNLRRIRVSQASLQNNRGQGYGCSNRGSCS